MQKNIEGCTNIYAINYNSNLKKHNEKSCDYGPFGKKFRLYFFLLKDTIRDLKSYNDIEKKFENPVFSNLKEKCYIDIILIIKNILPYLQKFTDIALSIKDNYDAKKLLNDDTTYQLIKKISNNVINIQKTQVTCFFDNMKGEKGKQFRKEIISNSIKFNKIDEDNLKKYEKNTSKIFTTLQKSISTIINIIILFAESNGYDKSKLDKMVDIKNNLLILLIDNKFIKTNNELLCYSNIDELKKIITSEFENELKKNASEIENKCNQDCDNEIKIIKDGITNEMDKKCNTSETEHKNKLEILLNDNKNKLYNAGLLKKKAKGSLITKKYLTLICGVLLIIFLISWLFIPNFFNKKKRR